MRFVELHALDELDMSEMPRISARRAWAAATRELIAAAEAEAAAASSSGRGGGRSDGRGRDARGGGSSSLLDELQAALE